MLTLLHSEWPKLLRVLVILSAIGLNYISLEKILSSEAKPVHLISGIARTWYLLFLPNDYVRLLPFLHASQSKEC